MENRKINKLLLKFLVDSDIMIDKGISKGSDYIWH